MLATAFRTNSHRSSRNASNTPSLVVRRPTTPGLGGERHAALVAEHVVNAHYDELQVEFDANEGVLWYFMSPEMRPSATVGLMEDIGRMQRAIRAVFELAPNPADPPIRYMVLASRMPGIFNLGGDLNLFAKLIRAGDRQALHDYARLSIGVIHANAVNLGLPLITVSLVQGDALGGGFEAALSSNLIIAERGAKFGLPEILFNLFPGMGAYSFLARRIDPAQAERLILSGRVMEADELHAMGVIYVIADAGRVEQAFFEHLRKCGRLFTAHRSIYRVRNRVNPVQYEEMADIADAWVDAALQISDQDITRMERLATAQDRRWTRIRDAAAAVPTMAAE